MLTDYRDGGYRAAVPTAESASRAHWWTGGGCDYDW